MGLRSAYSGVICQCCGDGCVLGFNDGGGVVEREDPYSERSFPVSTCLVGYQDLGLHIRIQTKKGESLNRKEIE